MSGVRQRQGYLCSCACVRSVLAVITYHDTNAEVYFLQ